MVPLTALDLIMIHDQVNFCNFFDPKKSDEIEYIF